MVSHILLVQERLARMSELVTENMRMAKSQQKLWYDRHARDRDFRTGDQVLVLLPTTTSKLLAQWQGPYTITRRIGAVNYEVDMAGRRKRRRIFHINMLKPWNTPTATTSFLAREVADDTDENRRRYRVMEGGGAG